MSRQSSRLICILLLAVLFVPLLIQTARAVDYNALVPTGVERPSPTAINTFCTKYVGMGYEVIWVNSIYETGTSHIMLYASQKFTSIEWVNNERTEIKSDGNIAIMGSTNTETSVNQLTITWNTGGSMQYGWINGGEISIEDIGLPEKTMNYYITMAQVVDGKPSETIYYHEYMEMPTFTTVEPIDTAKAIYNMGWQGTGVSRAWKYTEETGWQQESSTLPSESWEVTASVKKIYATNMQIPGMTSTVPDIATGKVYGGGFNTEGYGIRFLMPRDGFKDNSFLFTYLVEYRIPWTDQTANPNDVTALAV
jgi:hypothetical protein